MYLANRHNTDIHHQRVDNKGVLKAQFEAAEELDGTTVDIQPALYDQVDETEYPSALNFVPPDTFREVMEQKPLSLDEISVSFPLHNDMQRLEETVMIEKSKLFFAQPPKSKVAYADMTVIQQWAVNLGVDKNQKIIYLAGRAGAGKTEVALHICERLKGRVQAGAVTGKAASNFNGPTVHGMFGWSFEGYRDGQPVTCSSRKLGELRAFYEKTDVFVVDEINAMSAENLTQLDETLTAIFNPNAKKNLPFGGKKMIFLGDPAQLKPVAGEAIYAAGSGGQTKASKVRGSRGLRQSRYLRTSRGQELYRKYIEPNCIFLQRGQRSSGLLQEICDRLRNGEQTDDDLNKVTFQRRHFPNFITDFGIRYENFICSRDNVEHLWTECKAATPPKRLFICKASYHMTNDNQPLVDALSALPPTKFGFAADVLCLSIGCDVRLVKNINVSAGLVNSASGKVVKIIYNNADVQALCDGRNPPPYCVIVDFGDSFRGFTTKTDPTQRMFPFPRRHTCVPIYRQKFVPVRSDLPSWMNKKQETSKCYREQFPLDLSRNITAHRAQGQTLGNCTVSVDFGLDNPDHQLPPDMGSIIYVAFTRVPRLQNLFVGTIFPSVWEKIGQSTADHERRETEMKLIEAARKFSSERG
jgi:hypothetical protein